MGKGTSRRAVTKIRGENEPRKPPTEYFLFLRDERKNIEKGMVAKDKNALLNRLWKELSPERKKQYAEEYTREMLVYRKKMEEYKLTDEYKTVLKAKSAAKQAAQKPKRKPSGYNLFVREERQRITEGKKGADVPSFKELSQQISAKWNTLEEAAKNGYKERAAQLKDEPHEDGEDKGSFEEESAHSEEHHEEVKGQTNENRGLA